MLQRFGIFWKSLVQISDFLIITSSYDAKWLFTFSLKISSFQVQNDGKIPGTLTMMFNNTYTAFTTFSMVLIFATANAQDADTTDYVRLSEQLEKVIHT